MKERRYMTTEASYRIAFLILLVMLLSMRVYFMVKLRRSGGRIMPDEKAVKREGGRGFFLFRVLLFFTLVAFLGMYIAGMAWVDLFLFRLPEWLRWIGFAIGILSVAFMTWTQVTLDTQWSAQLQLRKDHHLITTGPYARMRHPLYTSTFGWGAALSLLTAHWIFVAVSVLAIIGLMLRIPKEEQMMIEAFGDEYKAYMRRTGRFFPKW
jgi:protein-S-isoprenylcysteine O-methyltransferase Ste14